MSTGMTRQRLNELLDELAGARVGVIGDFCLDAYWLLDTGPGETSLETGKPTRAVREQRYSLGGAGNVVANLASLGIRSLYGFSVISDDLFGREMLALLKARNVDTFGMIVQNGSWDTPVYAKPYLRDVEQERMDFGRWNRISPETETKLSGALRTIVPRLDAVIVNQQLTHGIYSDGVVRAINAIAAGNPSVTFLLDSRNMSDRFTGMVLKVNALEAARICASPETPAVPLPRALREYARRIAGKTGRVVFITRSEEGILLSDGRTETELPAVRVEGPTDPVGAGDTTASAIAAALATGATPREAADLGNLAAAVTVTKLRQTGTATPAEIAAVADCARVPHNTRAER
jgi:rfaE bifunctional protein kinase chain/domain